MPPVVSVRAALTYMPMPAAPALLPRPPATGTTTEAVPVGHASRRVSADSTPHLADACCTSVVALAACHGHHHGGHRSRLPSRQCR